jgi:hypothetical protein
MAIGRWLTAARAEVDAATAVLPGSRAALAIMRRERSAIRPSEPARRHLDAAVNWIKRAQDSDAGGGVAWGYRARHWFGGGKPSGWLSPYPEVTGYIIPTMFRYNDLVGDRDSADRARRMVDWEISIQLPDGGFQGGILGSGPVSPSTFVTGQVLFGLVCAYQRFGDGRMLAAARRAGDWLLNCLDETGRFRRGYSTFCAPGPKAYEVRTGLALAELGELIGEPRYRNAAAAIADYTLGVQRDNGWFAENDLEYHEEPLTHTIGYVLEGLHGIGLLLHRQDCLEAVHRTLEALTGLVGCDGHLPGRWRENWGAAVDWVCLTGSVQIAGVFLRTGVRTGNRDFCETGKRLLSFVCATQDMRVGADGLDGGVRGSYPFNGRYGRWSVLSWATKFFCDAMMDYLSLYKPLTEGQKGQLLSPSNEKLFL